MPAEQETAEVPVELPPRVVGGLIVFPMLLIAFCAISSWWSSGDPESGVVTAVSLLAGAMFVAFLASVFLVGIALLFGYSG